MDSLEQGKIIRDDIIISKNKRKKFKNRQHFMVCWVYYKHYISACEPSLCKHE